MTKNEKKTARSRSGSSFFDGCFFFLFYNRLIIIIFFLAEWPLTSSVPADLLRGRSAPAGRAPPDFSCGGGRSASPLGSWGRAGGPCARLPVLIEDLDGRFHICCRGPFCFWRGTRGPRSAVCLSSLFPIGASASVPSESGRARSGLQNPDFLTRIYLGLQPIP